MRNICYINKNTVEKLEFKRIKIFVVILLFSWGNNLVAQNWNYTYPTGINKASVSGIAPIGNEGDYIIQSTDGTVTKIDASGNIIWTLNEWDYIPPTNNMMQESVAVIGNYILAINGNYWKLIKDVGVSAIIMEKKGWKLTDCDDGGDPRRCEYKGVPVRVKAINGDFIICGGLHRVTPAGNSVGGVYLDYITRVDITGDIIWQKSYNTMVSGPGGDMGAGINLITDVELWQEDKLVFVKSTSLLYADPPNGGSVSIINFSDGMVNSHAHMQVQVDPSDPDSFRDFASGGGFWDIEVEGNKARMIGYYKHKGVPNVPRIALFCTYHLATNTILNLRKWEIPNKELFLSKMQKIGGSLLGESSEYVVSASIYDESSNNYANEHVIISCNPSGTIFNEAYVVDNTDIRRSSPSLYPRSSTFYTNSGHLLTSGGVFLLGTRTADNELPLVRKTGSLSTLGCKTDIQINSVSWTAEVVYTWKGYPQDITETSKDENLGPGATGVVECCSDGVNSFGGPEVSIVGELDLCENNSITLTALVGVFPDPVSYMWSPGLETTPSITVTEPGTYTVVVASTINPSCETTVSVEVIGERWHKTTENTTGSEVTNDVVSDASGNVYMTGTFTNTTELEGGLNPNITITGGGSNPGDMYVAKYDNCGTLLWVANSDGGAGLCTGNSLVLDELNQMVYVTGNAQSSVVFNSSQSADILCGSGHTETLIPTLTTSGYVAQYDMGTGCLYFAEEVAIGVDTDCRTITVNENNGEIYLGGGSKLPSAGPNYYAFIYKYIPETGLGIGNYLDTYVWNIIDPGMVSASSSVVNDLDYDESGDVENRLYAIGNFDRLITLYDGSYTASATHPGPGAFMAAYEDTGMPNYITLRDGNGSGNSTMTGEGIAVDEATDDLFLIGSFTDQIPTAFSVAGIDPLISFNTNTHSYMVSFNLSEPSHRWAHQTHATTGSSDYVLGRDVTTVDGNAYFLHEFSGTHFIVDVDDLFEALPFVGNPIGNSHLGIVSFTESGIKNWMNVTESQFSTDSDNHKGNSICSDLNDHSFIAGAYDNKMSYYDGDPYSGDLIRTGSGDNAFVLRVQNLLGGTLRNSEQKNYSIHSDYTTPLSINLYPNPTTDNLNIHIEDFNLNDDNSYQLKIFNLLGEHVFSTDLKEANSRIDLHELGNGVYLLNLTKGMMRFHSKIIKQ